MSAEPLIMLFVVPALIVALAVVVFFTTKEKDE